MSVIRFKRFTRPQALAAMGRPLLLRFFDKFQLKRAEGELALPAPDLPEGEWLGELARLFASPEALPDSLVEALYAIDEMSTPEGQEQLEAAVAQAGLRLESGEGSTRHDLALQVWLAAPALLARIHNQHRMRRLSVFEYFSTTLPPEGRPPFAAPGPAGLQRIAELLDPWFARHQRGHNTSRIELYLLPESAPPADAGREFWFLVRHGDTFARAPKVEEQRTEIIHFRPQRDDVVVYAPEPDEIRVNSRTRGERDLYVRTFGLCLRGDEDYFRARNAYTLEPLRAAGPDALQADDIPGLDKVVLRGVQVALDNDKHLVTLEGEDLFGCPPRRDGEPIPPQGRLRCAAFDLHFTGCRRPRPLRIRPPNVLKIGRHCDAAVAHLWMARRAFRVGGLGGR
ncbi:MAG TPA: hypothetical protein VJA21_14475 [Verrucomicrobiae bacterium]